MGKRYYCDYCDKSFPDNLDQRKKHLRGVVHQRNRNQFYQSLQVTAWAKSSAGIDSRLTGQELLQQWLAKHPEIITRAVTGLQPEGGKEPAVQLSKMKRSDLMKSGYTSVTGMKYPPEVAQELANITDLPLSLHFNS